MTAGDGDDAALGRSGDHDAAGAAGETNRDVQPTTPVVESAGQLQEASEGPAETPTCGEASVLAEFRMPQPLPAAIPEASAGYPGAPPVNQVQLDAPQGGDRVTGEQAPVDTSAPPPGKTQVPPEPADAAGTDGDPQIEEPSELAAAGEVTTSPMDGTPSTYVPPAAKEAAAPQTEQVQPSDVPAFLMEDATARIDKASPADPAPAVEEAAALPAQQAAPDPLMASADATLQSEQPPEAMELAAVPPANVPAAETPTAMEEPIAAREAIRSASPPVTMEEDDVPQIDQPTADLSTSTAEVAGPMVEQAPADRATADVASAADGKGTHPPEAGDTVDHTGSAGVSTQADELPPAEDGGAENTAAGGRAQPIANPDADEDMPDAPEEAEPVEESKEGSNLNSAEAAVASDRADVPDRGDDKTEKASDDTPDEAMVDVKPEPADKSPAAEETGDAKDVDEPPQPKGSGAEEADDGTLREPSTDPSAGATAPAAEASTSGAKPGDKKAEETEEERQLRVKAEKEEAEAIYEEQLSLLRTNWMFASTMQFFRIFVEPLKLRRHLLNSDLLEGAIMRPWDNRLLLGEILFKLLRSSPDIPYSDKDCDKFEVMLEAKMRQKWEQHFDSNPMEEKSYFALLPSERVRLLPPPSPITSPLLCYSLSACLHLPVSKAAQMPVQMHIMYLLCEWRLVECNATKEALKRTV